MVTRRTVAEVAEEVFRRYGARWKPHTLTVNRRYHARRILPALGDVPIADVDRPMVVRWMADQHATPHGANRTLPILSVIMAQAELYGDRPEGSNPCKGVRRFTVHGRERFLDAAELRRLGGVLDELADVLPATVTCVRLLLLTGCRQGEIRALKWSDYRDGHLRLRDSKTGPRTVWLSKAARALLDGLPRRGQWVLGERLPAASVHADWTIIRREAGMDDVRLHDLRHTYASVALALGESVVSIGRLLGHRDPDTTLKYLHWSDPQTRAASEQVGAVLDGGGG